MIIQTYNKNLFLIYLIYLKSVGYIRVSYMTCHNVKNVRIIHLRQYCGIQPRSTTAEIRFCCVTKNYNNIIQVN